jgi:predicted PurR-regulated permease PerM
MLAFLLEFIPIIGVFVSGVACVLIALSKGIILALIVLAYFVVVHVIESDVVGPRIVGHAIGVHPIVSIFALLAGAELFGLWGALFASPVAGVAQAFLVEFWHEWRTLHPAQFPETAHATTPGISGTDVPGGAPPIPVSAERMEEDEGRTHAMQS